MDNQRKPTKAKPDFLLRPAAEREPFEAAADRLSAYRYSVPPTSGEWND
jgi:hypothetical protein